MRNGQRGKRAIKQVNKDVCKMLSENVQNAIKMLGCSVKMLKMLVWDANRRY